MPKPVQSSEVNPPVPAIRRGRLRRSLGAGVVLLAIAGVATMILPKRAVHESTSRCRQGERGACASLCDEMPPKGFACVLLAQQMEKDSEVDQTRQVELYSRACSAGAVDGCSYLGRAQARGQGTARDFESARTNLQRGCASGNSVGCVGFAELLLAGLGGPQDVEQAVSLLNKACTANEISACVSLATVLMHGNGAPKDEKTALSLFEKACGAANAQGCAGKGYMLLEGIGVESRPAEGLDLLLGACRDGAKAACAQVGMAYSLGNKVPADPARAVGYLMQGCSEAPPAGCVQLAAHLEHGAGVQPDPGRAAQLLDRACSTGDEEGCVRFARALLQGGLGLTRDEDRAVRMIHNACAKGSPAGCTELAAIESRGVGPVAKDLATAKARAEQACTQGYAEACTLAGNLRLPDARSEAEVARVFGLFHRACQGGDARGCTTAASMLSMQRSKQAVAQGLELLSQSCTQLKTTQVCAAYAAALANGAAGSGRTAEGVRLAETYCAAGDAASCWVAVSTRRASKVIPRDREREARLIILGCRLHNTAACDAKQALPSELIQTLEQQPQAGAAGGATTG